MKKHVIKTNKFFSNNFSLAITLIFLFLTVNGVCQRVETTELPLINKSKYLRFLLYKDSSTQSNLFYFKIQYSYVDKKIPFRNGGINTSIGFNLARFFNDKIIFGLCYNFKFLPGFTRQYFTSEFKSDFNNESINVYRNQQDSIKSDIFYRTINNINNYRSVGNSFHNIGITFSPFPQKYGAILLQLTKGFSIFPFYGNYPTENLTKDNSPVEFVVYNKYCFEISCKPYRFFNSRRDVLNDQKIRDWYKFIVLSFFYQKNDLRNSFFAGRKLENFVSNSFIDKYDNKGFFGFKIGFGLY